ncbi:MAG: hypothetical protein MN733_29630, partial [Nitrososphaera sp.]|nr:hypothetical protein [Nitrososphaera sp.]
VALHFASTLGTRSLGLFAATYPNICGPMNMHGGAILVPQERPSACQQPCHQIECPSKEEPCITRIPVLAVASTMEKLWV